MNDYLKKLREITPKLPQLNTKLAFGLIEYETDGKPIVGIGLYHEKNKAAVQRCFFPAGTTLVAHMHDEVEIIVVYVGCLEFFGECGDVTVGVGETITFPAGTVHGARAIGDTELFAITIPAGDGYPHA